MSFRNCDKFIFEILLLNWYLVMFKDLSLCSLLIIFAILLFLWMLILNIFGSFLWLSNMMFLLFFNNFKLKLKDNFLLKLNLYKWIKVVIIENWTLILKLLVFNIDLSVHILINKMAQLNINTDILLKLVSTCLNFLGHCKAPLKFCFSAFETFVYLINCMPTLVLNNKTPFECLFKSTPYYSFLCIFFGVYIFPTFFHLMITS